MRKKEKQRHHFVDKCLHSQIYGFSSSHVWMWELDHKEDCMVKKWCFQTVVSEKHLRVPWTARWSNQSILREINPECSLEGWMLKFQYFGHLMWRVNSLEKTLMLGKIGGRGRKGWQRMRWLDGIMTQLTQVWANFGRWWRTEKPGVLQFMVWQRVGHDLVTEQQLVLLRSCCWRQRKFFSPL